MSVQNQFAPDEWYHCYNRGIDKRIVYKQPPDYDRFLQLLYVCNATEKIHRSDLLIHTTLEILQIPRSGTLTQIGAFCLMPNHFHLLLKESVPGGISAFMQKLGTAYTMYFNIKNKRTGGLFGKPFKSRHISDDRYFQRAIQYIHFNPAELFEPAWKTGEVEDVFTLRKNLQTYPYSSLNLFTNPSHELRQIVDTSVFEIETQIDPLQALLEAQEYYQQCGKATP